MLFKEYKLYCNILHSFQKEEKKNIFEKMKTQNIFPSKQITKT
jgi:hypothetical protein